MSDIHEEVRQVLTDQDDIKFEELAGEENSPLNQPVVEKDDDGQQPEPVQKQSNSQEEWERTDTSSHQEEQPEHIEAEEVDDASEQEIDDNYSEATIIDEEEEFELPTGHAKQAADTILGMTDNVLEVGGGYFVKIRKHKEFYDFEEIIQVIDQQNTKNVKRIKLDEEDKILLRPLLIAILKKKAKKLTPEQQLLGAIISILMKKAQVVMEIKAENEILTERILDIVREEKGYSEQDEDYDEDEQQDEEQESQEEEVEEPEVEEVVVKHPTQQPFEPEQVLEVAEDATKKPDEKEKK
jgi:hypothetical protein